MKSFSRNILVLVILFISQLTSAQQVINAEYFWDADPGVGSATPIAALDGSLDEAIEDLFTSSVSIPTAGLHTFNIRIKGLDNTWSNLFSYVINIGSSTLNTRDVEVIQAEYFWDTDPGLGSATTILAFDGSLDEAIEDLFNSAVSVPSTGLHTFNIRIKGLDNTWSNLFSYVINVGSPTLISRDVEVTQAEYYWDTDPGAGSATPILAFDGNLDEAIESLFDGGIASPTAGFHTFNLRVKGFDGSWSSTFAYVINVETQTLLTRDVNVTQAEYFWDTDPGVGNGAVLLALDGNLDEAIESLFDGSVSIPSNGLHTFNVRVRGFDGSWSTTFSYVIDVGTPTLISRGVKVIQAEYFWDVDPGLGSGSPILALDGNLDEAVEDVFQNTLTPTSIGLHVFNLRVKGQENTWSTTFKYIVDVLDSNSYSSINESICDGSSYTVPSGDETYTVTGIYSDTLPNANGFDSLITINLFVQPPSFSTINPTACGSYLSPEGNTYTSSGTYTDVIQTMIGCDSTITINLTIQPNSFATLSESACDSYASPSGNYVWTSSGTYIDTVPSASGCDSILTINLTINSASLTTQSITACDSYTWAVNGSTYTTSGSYQTILTNVEGCDSIITLNLTVGYSYTDVLTITACDSYFWAANGQTYTSSGSYSISTFTGLGCDSISTLNLTIGTNSVATQTITGCDNYVWPLNGTSYSASGTYTATIPNSFGCDSVVTLNLTINSSSVGAETITACDSYFWALNGNTYTSSGMYSATLTNAVGCDSTITLNLTINNSYSNTSVITECGSYVWPVNGTTYSSSGLYDLSLLTSAGCDSILYLDLTIGSNTTATINVSSCGAYTWPLDGQLYANSGSYVTTISNSNGCDSIVQMNLTINLASSGTSNIVTCESYTWSATGLNYTNSGSYTATLSNTVGCDSIATLNLTITSGSSSTSTISACNSYFWSATGQTYSSSGTYETTLVSQAGCDSTLTLNLTVNTLNAMLFQTDNVLTASPSGGTYEWLNCTTGAPIVSETGQEFIAMTNGDYAVVVSLNGCSDTSNCVTVDNADIDQHFLESISLYPNPTDGKFTLDFGDFKDNLTITLRDLRGRLLQSNDYKNVESIDIFMEYPTGMYFVEITSDTENAVLRVVLK